MHLIGSVEAIDMDMILPLDNILHLLSHSVVYIDKALFCITETALISGLVQDLENLLSLMIETIHLR